MTQRRAHLLSALTIAIVAFVYIALFFSIPHHAHAAMSLQEVTGVRDPATNAPIIEGSGESWYTKLAGWIFRPFALLFYGIATLFSRFGALLLDNSIDFSIIQPLDRFAGIQVGWTVMRDFANLFFIFIILYIAIKTILQLGGHDTRQMLVRVIVVALLINFSGFFTKVVIDMGNILAVGFYDKIITSPAPFTNSQYCPPTSTTLCTLSTRFNSAMNVNNLLDNGNLKLGTMQTTVIYVLMGIVLLVAGTVFLQGAFYFIARTVVFAFLIMLSPVAFLTYAIPNSRMGVAINTWWSKLIGYAFLAPAYMIIIYLVLQIVGRLNTTATFDIMDFILIIFLLYMGSKMAFRMADAFGNNIASMGTSMARYGRGLAVGASVGAFTATSGYLGRQTAGRAGEALANSDRLKDRVARGGVSGRFAEMRLKGYEKLAKASFDASQTKAGGALIGKAGSNNIPAALQKKGGFRASGATIAGLGLGGNLTKDQEERIIKEARDLFPNDPVRREEYIRSRMGTTKNALMRAITGSERKENFDESKTKAVEDERSKINAEKKKKEKQADLEENVKEARLKALEAKTEDKTVDEIKELEKVTADLEKLKKSRGDRELQSIDTIMNTIGPAMVSDMKEDVLLSPMVAEHLNKAHLAKIHTKYSEGKYQDVDFMNKISDNIYKSSNEQAKSYIASNEGRKNVGEYIVDTNYNYVSKKFKTKDALVKKKDKEIDRHQKEIDGLENELKSYDSSASDYLSSKSTSEQRVRELKEKIEKARDERENLQNELDVIRDEEGLKEEKKVAADATIPPTTPAA